MKPPRRHQRPLALLLAAVLLAGCAAQGAYKRARAHSDAEDWDQAVYYYAKALSMEPQNMEYRKSLEHAKVKASQHHLELAKRYMAAQQLDPAIVEYRVAASLDPTNRYAADSLENAVEQKKKQEEKPLEKSDIERMKDESKGGGATPILSPSSVAPITLNFPPNTKVKDIYVALGKAGGINVLFDAGVRDQETFSIDIANISFKKALDQVAIANKHFYKVIDEKTILIVPDNPQKRRDYEDHVIKTFYLSNANPNDVVNTLRGLLDARRIATNQPLNAITIRDTPAKITVMERVIEANDKPPSEVVIDVEILEVRKSHDLRHGTRLSTYEVNEVLDQPDDINGVRGLRWSSIPFINAGDWLLTFPSIFYRLEKNQGNIRTLARPSLRALDGKQVTLRLGDQVPIETSTFSTGVVGNQPLTRNFQFRDIGTNIDITPRVHHNNEVTLQLQVEVTSVGEDPDGPSGSIPPTFGNRRINTEIRLKDGETNLLAGLFTSSEEQSRSGLPILSDLPVLREIFGNNSRTKRETDIVLTLTPHIVRTPNIRKQDLEPFYVGTESNVGGVSDVSLGSSSGGSPFTPPAGGEGEEQPGRPQPGGRPTPAARPGFPPPGGAVPGLGGQPAALPGQPALPPIGQPRPQNPVSPGSPGATPAPFNPAPNEPAPTSVLPASGGLAPAGPAGGAPPAGATPAPTPAPSTPARLSLAPAAVSIAAGQEFTLDVVIADAVAVSHAPFYLVFDPAVLQAIDVAQGSFLGQDGKPVSFLRNVPAASTPPKPEDGQVSVGLSRLGHVPGVSGAGVLATARFRARAKGTSLVSLGNVSLRDAGQRSIPAIAASATVIVP